MAKNFDPVGWMPDIVRIGDLVPWDGNPRRISKKRAERLAVSFERWGAAKPLNVGPRPGNKLYDGHQRLSLLLALHGPDFTMPVYRALRELTDDELREFVLALNGGADGTYNFEELAGWDPQTLLDGGFDQERLGEINTEAAAIRSLLSSQYEYAPALDPSIGGGVVTDADVERKALELSQQFKGERDLMTVTCPHCGGEFEVDAQ